MEICGTFTILILIVTLSIVVVGLVLTAYELLRAPLIKNERRGHEENGTEVSGES